MYSDALTATARYWGFLSVSYTSRNALATNAVHTRLGAHLGTSSVRVCHGKLYPQHQYCESSDRSPFKRPIICSIYSSMPSIPIRESFTKDERKSASAFGLCVVFIPNSFLKLNGLRLSAWVKAIRAILERNSPKEATTVLLRAS